MYNPIRVPKLFMASRNPIFIPKHSNKQEYSSFLQAAFSKVAERSKKVQERLDKVLVRG